MEPTLEGAFAPDGVDLTLIRWMLSLTPAERLQAAQDAIDALWALRGPEFFERLAAAGSAPPAPDP